MRRLSISAANAQAEAVASLLAGGTLEIRTGPMPQSTEFESADTPLAVFRLKDPAFLPAAGGIALINRPDDVLVDRNGRASWYRFRSKDGLPVIDGSIAVSGGAMDMRVIDLPRNATLDMKGYKLVIRLKQQ